MAGILISLILAAGMFAAIRGLALTRDRRPILPPMPGQLSVDERRRLYKRLGIDPAALARQQRSNVIWLDPSRAQPRTRV